MVFVYQAQSVVCQPHDIECKPFPVGFARGLPVGAPDGFSHSEPFVGSLWCLHKNMKKNSYHLVRYEDGRKWKEQMPCFIN